MKWFGISGSWRVTNSQVEQDVREMVKKIIMSGNGIISGGALGVDWFAVDEALKHDLSAQQIKVIIPTGLSQYLAHYRRRVQEGVITHQQAEQLMSQLNTLQNLNPKALIEIKHGRLVNQKSYSHRNWAVVEASDGLYAFQVNLSQGTQDTVDKARKKGIPIFLKRYVIDD